MLSTTSACKRRKREQSAAAKEEPSGMATMIHTADARASAQLVKGFHDIETSWRWTHKSFSIVLKPPANAAKNGATLQVQLAAAEPVMKVTGPQTLSAKIGPLQLAPETFAKPGQYTYTRDVPASAFQSDAVVVEFALDKAATGLNGDIRELGVIVSLIGFEAKQ